MIKYPLLAAFFLNYLFKRIKSKLLILCLNTENKNVVRARLRKTMQTARQPTQTQIKSGEIKGKKTQDRAAHTPF